MGRASGTGAAFYRQLGREEEGESKLCFDLEPLRWTTGESRRVAEAPAGGAGGTQAAWRSGEASAEEARAVEERWGDAWAREEQEVDGGGQGRRTAPAAGEPEEQSRGAEVQGGRR
jgi:hypothetical protein